MATTKYGEIKRCSVCGEDGHNKKFHEPQRKSKPCKMCKRTLLMEQFRIQRAVRLNGRIAENRSYICNNCDVKKSGEWYRRNPKNRLSCLLRSAKSRKSQKGRKFDIDTEYLLRLYEQQKGLCFYTKRPMSLQTGDSAISIERLNPDVGYKRGNVVLTCWIVNNAKRNMQQKDFIEMCSLVSKYHC